MIEECCYTNLSKNFVLGEGKMKTRDDMRRQENGQT